MAAMGWALRQLQRTVLRELARSQPIFVITSKHHSGLDNKHPAINLFLETGFYAPPLEGKIATDTFKIAWPMGRGILYTTGAEADNSAVNFQGNQYQNWIKIGLS